MTINVRNRKSYEMIITRIKTCKIIILGAWPSQAPRRHFRHRKWFYNGFIFIELTPSGLVPQQ